MLTVAPIGFGGPATPYLDRFAADIESAFLARDEAAAGAAPTDALAEVCPLEGGEEWYVPAGLNPQPGLSLWSKRSRGPKPMSSSKKPPVSPSFGASVPNMARSR